jgi:hypothetical protein
MIIHPPVAGSLRMPAATTVLSSVAAACVAVALAASPGSAAKREPVAAHAGLVFAEAAAQVWAPDAALVYIENDDDVVARGNANRWGYLFYSPGRQKARAYSVRSGRIVVAEDLAMTFAAPPVAVQWIDSEAALAAADAHGGREYCRAHAGQVGTMLLARGTFQQDSPDLTTWTVVYTSPTAPSLFVVVDAAHGKLCRTWRG